MKTIAEKFANTLDKRLKKKKMAEVKEVDTVEFLSTKAGSVLYPLLEKAVSAGNNVGMGCKIVTSDDGTWLRGLRWENGSNECLMKMLKTERLSVKIKEEGALWIVRKFSGSGVRSKRRKDEKKNKELKDEENNVENKDKPKGSA